MRGENPDGPSSPLISPLLPPGFPPRQNLAKCGSHVEEGGDTLVSFGQGVRAGEDFIEDFDRWDEGLSPLKICARYHVDM